MIENKDLRKINDFMHLALTEGTISEEECLDEISDVIIFRKKSKKERSKHWDSLRDMPPLYHRLPGTDFSLDKSEVLEWIGKDKQAMDWLMRSATKNGYISYDRLTGKWSGIKDD